MNDTFLVGMVHSIADRHKQFQTLPSAQPVLITVLGNRNPFDQFHHEIGPARLRCPGVENPGDVGMVHHGQDLSFGLKTGHDFPGVHAQFDDLQGHPTS